MKVRSSARRSVVLTKARDGHRVENVCEVYVDDAERVENVSNTLGAAACHAKGKGPSTDEYPVKARARS